MNIPNTKQAMKVKILPLAMIVLAAAALAGCKPHEADHSPAMPPAEPSAPAATSTNGPAVPVVTNSVNAINPTNTNP